MISEEDKNKLSELDSIERELSFQHLLIPVAFPLFLLMLVLKGLIQGVWDIPMWIIVAGIFGLIASIYLFSKWPGLKKRRTILRKELGFE